MNADEIKKYWGERASKGHQATTDDVYMKSIEYFVLKDWITRISNIHNIKSIIDIGCGDGRTTGMLAKQFPDIQFLGIDNAAPMVEEAKANSNHNVVYEEDDALLVCGSYDIAITVRCIINIPTLKNQMLALSNISKILKAGGYYLMIENFTSGQDKMNEARKLYGLKEIPVREHNLFLPTNRIIDVMSFAYELVDDINISSSYYLATRCVYARLCFDERIEPDYFSPYHRYAARLPFAGDYGPIRLLVWRKK